MTISKLQTTDYYHKKLLHLNAVEYDNPEENVIKGKKFAF